MAGRVRDGGALAVTGDVKYNGHDLNEFEVVRTSAYVGQVSDFRLLGTVRHGSTLRGRSVADGLFA